MEWDSGFSAGISAVPAERFLSGVYLHPKMYTGDETAGGNGNRRLSRIRLQAGGFSGCGTEMNLSVLMRCPI